MLINEVDAIPQRNRHNLSDLKKRRGSTQANAATKLYTLDAFRGRNAQYTQQNKENRRGNRKRRKGRGNERGKIENGFQLHRYYMFVEKMHKAYDRISMREERSIIIKGKECIYKVHTTELIYIEVQNHSLTFHTMQGNYMCTGSLKKVEKDLEGLPFARCSSSYLLNLMHVLRIEKEHVIMDNKDELLLSRLKRQEFMEILTDYYGGVQ